MSLSSSTVGGKIKYKVVLLGDQHVGKTSVIDRFINDRFESTYNATIGIDFLVRNLSYQNKNYRLQLWDTAGQQRFKSLIPSYLKDSNLCILVYDLGNLKSFENVEKWMQLYNQHKEYTAFCILVGNKNDISVKQCTDEVIEQKLKQWKDMHHYKISAKSGEGVNDLFYNVIDQINNRLNNIKIIDQIEERDQKQERQRESQADTAKPAIKQDHTSMRLDIPEKSEIAPRKKCC